MGAAKKLCTCRFCGGDFGPDGITNHETFCDENPNEGVPVEKQKELGLLDESGDGPEEAPDAEPNPDQRSAVGDGGLPPRRSPSGGKTVRDDDGCPNCGGEDTISTEQAREGFANEMGTLPSALQATLSATESYCNECWHVWGGALETPHAIMENPEGGA